MTNKFDEEFDRLAEEIAKESRQASVALADRVDAMKALFPYYALRQKSKPPEEDNEDTIAGMIAKIQETEDEPESKPGVRSRRQRHGTAPTEVN